MSGRDGIENALEGFRTRVSVATQQSVTYQCALSSDRLIASTRSPFKSEGSKISAASS